MAEVFISYSREDADRVRTLRTALDELRITTWLDESVEQGKDFEEAILEAMTSARVVVVCWSNAAASSKWVRREAREAERQSKYLGCQICVGEPGFGFETINNANLSAWSGDRQDLSFLAFVSEIGQRLGRDEIAGLLGAEKKRLADEAQKLRNAEEERQREMALARQLEAARIHAIEKRRAEERQRAFEKALSLKDRAARVLRGYSVWINPLVVVVAIELFFAPPWSPRRGAFTWFVAEFGYEPQYRFSDLFGEGDLDRALVFTGVFLTLGYLFSSLTYRWLLKSSSHDLGPTVLAIGLQWLVHGWFILGMMRG